MSEEKKVVEDMAETLRMMLNSSGISHAVFSGKLKRLDPSNELARRAQFAVTCLSIVRTNLQQALNELEKKSERV